MSTHQISGCLHLEEITGIRKLLDAVAHRQDNGKLCLGYQKKFKLPMPIKRDFFYLLLNSVLLSDYGLVICEAVHSCKRRGAD